MFNQVTRNVDPPSQHHVPDPGHGDVAPRHGTSLLSINTTGNIQVIVG